MNQMKKIFLLLAIVVTIFLVGTPKADAYEISITRNPGYYFGTGGEFSIDPTNGLSFVLSWYDSKAKIGTGDTEAFQSFCLERSEKVYPGTYNAFLNTNAVQGSVADPGGDPLSQGAAWLHQQFAEGTLDTYDYTPGDGRISSAAALQAAIWWLEGEITTLDEYSELGRFKKALLDEFDSYDDAKLDNKGKYRAMVLNLYTREGALAQDQIVYCVPEPGTLLLLGLGLLGIAGVRRKL